MLILFSSCVELKKSLLDALDCVINFVYVFMYTCSYLDISLDMEYSEKTQEEICHILLARVWGWNWGFVWILFIVKQRLQKFTSWMSFSIKNWIDDLFQECAQITTRIMMGKSKK